jgi:hypothetical protein
MGQTRDRETVRLSLIAELGRNSYFHAVPPEAVHGLASSASELSEPWELAVVETTDEAHEAAGWVLYRQVPALTIAYAYVEPSFRGLGAWRALRAHLGMRDGQLVNVVLASPQAMGLARKRYAAKHNWGQAIGWLT